MGTAQRRASEEQRRVMAAESRTILSRLVDVLIHDARNALSTAEANLSFVREAMGEAPDDLGDAIVDVVDSTHRVRETLDDIALVTKIHTGALAPRPAGMAVRGLFDSVARSLEHAARGRKLELTYDAKESVALEADPSLFRRAFEIAVEAGLGLAREGTKVVVRASRGERTKIEVLVRGETFVVPEAIYGDTGALMPDVLHGAAIRAYLLRAIVEAHGGTVEGGSSLCIEMPCAEAEEE